MTAQTVEPPEKKKAVDAGDIGKVTGPKNMRLRTFLHNNALRRQSTLIQDQRDEIQKMFEPIKISTFQLLMDPFIECLIQPFMCCLKLCMKPGKSDRVKRIETIEQAEEKLVEQLDIVNLLQKINTSHTMLSNLIKGEQTKLLEYAESKVIEVASEYEEEEDAKSEHETKSDHDEQSEAVECAIYAEAKKECQFANLERAFTYSMVHNSCLDEDQKLNMLR